MIRFNPVLCNYQENNESCSPSILISWNYEDTYQRGLIQENYRIVVCKDAAMTSPVFDSGILSGDSMSYELSLHYSPEQLTDYYLTVFSGFSDGEKVCSGCCHFRTGIFSSSFWNEKGCHWITPSCSPKKIPAAICFLKQFRLTVSERKKIIHAYAYLFASGFTTVEVNGIRPDDRLLAPANSVYEKHCYYETYNIEKLIRSGSNTLSCVCGSGYNADYSQYGYRYFGKKGLLGLIELQFQDGSCRYYPTDTDWKCSETSIISCSIYHGETVDASKNIFQHLSLKQGDKEAPYAPDGQILPREIPQIRIIRKDRPVAVYPSVLPERKPDPDSHFPGCPAIDGTLFDFGEVSAGIVRIRVKAPQGTVVHLFHTEMIFPDGSPDRYTNRSAASTDEYICSGNGVEEFLPEFTYHCFRYVHVSGLDASSVVDIEKCILSSDFEKTGHFECSDALICRIHKNMVTGMRNNLFSIPTDCAVRDERTPCAMDSQAIEKSVMYNFRTAAYYKKWLQDVCDKFRAGTGIGNPDWNGDIVSLMWRIRNFYGDLRPAKEFFDDGAALFLNDCASVPEGIWEKGYGDWCNPNQNSWDTFFGSVTAVNTSLLYGMGKKLLILGREIGEEEKTLQKIESETERIRKTFNEKCVKKDGTVLGGRQSEMILPLYEGILTEDNEVKVREKLRKKLRREKKNDIGIYGAMSLYELLSRFEDADLATALLHNPEYPGYGFQIAKGATSLWEQWRYKGRMDSHSHGMFAGPDAAFYQMYAGITPTAPAFREVKIHPLLPAGMSFVKATLQTPVGKIEVGVYTLCNGYEINLVLPIGCKANIIFPELPGSSEDYAFFDGEKEIAFSPALTLTNGIYRFRRIPKALQTDH